ncbi:hypothetical protein RI367_003258 [Sorochytrium milnesiophthora]
MPAGRANDESDFSDDQLSDESSVEGSSPAATPSSSLNGRPPSGNAPMRPPVYPAHMMGMAPGYHPGQPQLPVGTTYRPGMHYPPNAYTGVASAPMAVAGMAGAMPVRGAMYNLPQFPGAAMPRPPLNGAHDAAAAAARNISTMPYMGQYNVAVATSSPAYEETDEDMDSGSAVPMTGGKDGRRYARNANMNEEDADDTGSESSAGEGSDFDDLDDDDEGRPSRRSASTSGTPRGARGRGRGRGRGGRASGASGNSIAAVLRSGTGGGGSDVRVSPSRKSWLVPYEHVSIPFGHTEDRVMEKILAHKADPSAPGGVMFLVKWKNLSYLHRTWISQAEVEQQQNGAQRIQRYYNKIHENTSSWGEEGFNPAYLRIDRIIDEGEVNDAATDTVHVYYLVKWENQPYDCASWEPKETCDEIDPDAVQEYLRRREIPDYKRSAQQLQQQQRPPPNQWAKYAVSPDFKNGNQLRQYQLDGVNWLVFCWLNRNSSIMADEMGLGKTVQSVAFLNELWSRFNVRGPFLVVAPLSTVPHWEREFRAWTDMNVIVYHGNATSRNLIVDTEYYWKDQNGQHYPDVFRFDVLITTYEMAMAGEKQLKPIQWRACVLDEAHKLKNKTSKISELLKLFHMDHKVLLTGTPLQNSLDELWALLNFMDPVNFPSEEQFMAHYGSLKSSADVERLQMLLKPLMLRRLKEDVEKSIPIKEETVVEVELTNIQKKWYRAILERNFSMLKKGSKGRDAMPSLINIVMELRKCCIHPYLLHGAEDIITQEASAHTPEEQYRCMIQASGKLVLLDKLLKKLRDGGHKVLIFSQMTKCLDILGDYLRGQNLHYERIDGNIRGTERQAAIDRFSQPDSESFVFLLCTRAGGVGINLTAADTAIIFDSDWNPQNDLQAQARCHRIGQTKPVQIYRLITRNTYEKEMFDRAGFKLGLDKAVLQKMSAESAWGDEPEKRLSKKEVEELLKKGAYGAFMDDSESNAFCEEDIDQILTRRTTVIKHDNSANAGSIFSKATFASEDPTNDIDINDPNFWDKVAEKASLDIQEPVDPTAELIIHEPRHRRAMQRAYDRVIDMQETEMGEFVDEAYAEGINRWSSTEKLMFERRLMVFGMFNWPKLHEAFTKRSIRDLKACTRDLIRHLVRKCTNPAEDLSLMNDCEAAVVQYCEPGLLPFNEEMIPYEGANARQVTEYRSFLVGAPKEYIEGVEKKGKYMLARIQLLKQIYDILPADLSIAKYLEVPPTTRPPADWWGVAEDRDLLISIAKHGYHIFGPMRRDRELVFSRRRYDPVTLRNEVKSKGKRGSRKKGAMAEDEEDDMEGLDADLEDTPYDPTHHTDDQVYPWPSKSEIGARLRKVVHACLREMKRRGSILAVPPANGAALHVPSGPRNEPWPKRERLDFMRTLIGFGADITDDGVAHWDRFRELAALEHKPDVSMNEYYEHIIAVCKHVIDVDNARVTGKEVAPIERWEGDEEYTVDRARKVLKRNDFLRYLRNRVLAHQDFDALIMTARKTSSVPEWWVLGTHDRALLRAVSKHGFGRSDAIISDPEYPFAEMAVQFRNTPGSTQEYETDTTKKKVFSIILGLPWPKDSSMQKRVEGMCMLIDPHPPTSEYYSQPPAPAATAKPEATAVTAAGGDAAASFSGANGAASTSVVPAASPSDTPPSEFGTKIVIETWRKFGKRKRVVIEVTRDIIGSTNPEDTETIVKAVATFLQQTVGPSANKQSASTPAAPSPARRPSVPQQQQQQPVTLSSVLQQPSSSSSSSSAQQQHLAPPPLAKFGHAASSTPGTPNAVASSPSLSMANALQGRTSSTAPSSPTSTIGEEDSYDDRDTPLSSSGSPPSVPHGYPQQPGRAYAPHMPYPHQMQHPMHPHYRQAMGGGSTGTIASVLSSPPPLPPPANGGNNNSSNALKRSPSDYSDNNDMYASSNSKAEGHSAYASKRPRHEYQQPATVNNNSSAMDVSPHGSSTAPPQQSPMPPLKIKFRPFSGAASTSSTPTSSHPAGEDERQ